MNRLTLGMARTSLPGVCFPPGASASAELAAPHINTVTRSFFSHGKWSGTVQNVVFKLWNDQLTLPRNIGVILGASIRGTGDRSLLHGMVNVRNEWFQFISGAFGISVNPPQDVFDLVQQGDGLVTFRPLPSAGHLKIVTTNTESPELEFHLRGRRLANKIFTATPEGSGQIEGETLSIPTTKGGTATTLASFDELYSITKSPTDGVVLLYHVATDGTQTLVGTYEPGETLPCYRQYLTPLRGSSDDVVVARVKLRHVDAVTDNDEIIPGNLNALELGMQALGFRRNGDTVKMAEYMNLAIDELNSELAEETAEQSWGKVQIDPSGMIATSLMG